MMKRGIDIGDLVVSPQGLRNMANALEERGIEGDIILNHFIAHDGDKVTLGIDLPE